MESGKRGTDRRWTLELDEIGPSPRSLVVMPPSVECRQHYYAD
jgi:hypothetical protein